MGVLSAAEKDGIDVLSAGIHVPGPRSAAWPPAAGGRRATAGPLRPPPGGARSLTWGGQVPGGQAPGRGVSGRRVSGRGYRAAGYRAAGYCMYARFASASCT